MGRLDAIDPDLMPLSLEDIRVRAVRSQWLLELQLPHILWATQSGFVDQSDLRHGNSSLRQFLWTVNGESDPCQRAAPCCRGERPPRRDRPCFRSVTPLR